MDDPTQIQSPLDLVALPILRPRVADHTTRPRPEPERMPLVRSPERGLASAGALALHSGAELGKGGEILGTTGRGIWRDPAIGSAVRTRVSHRRPACYPPARG